MAWRSTEEVSGETPLTTSQGLRKTTDRAASRRVAFFSRAPRRSRARTFAWSAARAFRCAGSWPSVKTTKTGFCQSSPSRSAYFWSDASTETEASARSRTTRGRRRFAAVYWRSSVDCLAASNTDAVSVVCMDPPLLFVPRDDNLPTPPPATRTVASRRHRSVCRTRLAHFCRRSSSSTIKSRPSCDATTSTKSESILTSSLRVVAVATTICSGPGSSPCSGPGSSSSRVSRMSFSSGWTSLRTDRSCSRATFAW
mmetsp:Transcript_30266/g.97572  ORF Transcript_30266/g.97572 Transcript_30266/m.97572 type:complete len:255 (-) Transcript_30266:89-853(-)